MRLLRGGLVEGKVGGLEVEEGRMTKLTCSCFPLELFYFVCGISSLSASHTNRPLPSLPLYQATDSFFAELIAISRQQLDHSRKQSRALAFMSREAMYQYRARLNVWSSGKRSNVEQQDFKNELVANYQRASTLGEGFLLCMILNVDIPRKNVIASHIWKFCTEGEGLEDFRLKASDLGNFRNGFLLCENIEKAFDTKSVCFLVNRLRPQEISLKVLDPNLFDRVVCPASPTVPPETFRSIDGHLLQHPPDVLPFRRILDFHAKLSYRKAIAKGWIEESSVFDDFFDLSLGGSIPDIDVYDHGVNIGSDSDEQDSTYE